jgi:hypothetical protein
LEFFLIILDFLLFPANNKKVKHKIIPPKIKKQAVFSATLFSSQTKNAIIAEIIINIPKNRMQYKILSGNKFPELD